MVKQSSRPTTAAADLVANDPYADFVDIPIIGETRAATPAGRRITPFSIVWLLAGILLTGVVGWGIYQNLQGPLKDGDAPDFTLQIYDDTQFAYHDPNLQMDYARESLQLSDFEGDRVVVLNFWNSNCPPCHEEADRLVEVYNSYRDQGVIFIGIDAKDPDKNAHEYIVQHSINYPNGLDRGDRIQKMYRTTGYPETFIIDREGQIQWHYAGPVSESDLRDEIDSALQGG